MRAFAKPSSLFLVALPAWRRNAKTDPWMRRSSASSTRFSSIRAMRLSSPLGERNNAREFFIRRSIEVASVILGRVVGKVVATIKNDTLIGQRLLIVQPIDRFGRDKGKPVVALDSVGAGAGESVYWCRGKEASFPFLPGE